jgi:hypothetical protein
MQATLRRVDRCGLFTRARPGQFGVRALAMAACLCLGLAIGSRPALARDTLEDFYVNNDNRCLPRPRLLVTSGTGVDADVFRSPQIQMDAILAVLNYELATNVWDDLDSGFRKPAVYFGSPGIGQLSGLPSGTQVQGALLAILNDPLLTITYTGKQSTLAHTSGAQTLDVNNIIINQEGLHAGGAPLSYYTIAQHVLHEVGHVFQQRNWTYIHEFLSTQSQKEVLPLQLESKLSPTNFSPGQIARMAQYLKAARSIEGKWNSNFGPVTIEYDPSTPFTGDKPVTVSGYWDHENDENNRGRFVGGRYDPVTRRVSDFTWFLGGDSGPGYFQLSCGGQTLRGACGAPWICWRDLSFPKKP